MQTERGQNECSDHSAGACIYIDIDIDIHGFLLEYSYMGISIQIYIYICMYIMHWQVLKHVPETKAGSAIITCAEKNHTDAGSFSKTRSD